MANLVEVLEFQDDTGQVMAHRIPSSGVCEIKWGAQLTVRESQVAVFFRDGKAIDVFGPGRHVLATQNIPVVAKWVTSFAYGEDSPFRAEVYFLNTKLFSNLKWGTREPILFRDTELHMLRLRSHGIFSMQITEPSLFLNKVVGTQGRYTNHDIADYLKSIITSRLITILGEQVKTVFDLPQQYDTLSIISRQAVKADFKGLGLEIHDFHINAISIPPEVQKMVDARAGMSAVGDMNSFMKFKTALAMEAAAANTSGGAGEGMGIGAGMGMGLMIPQMISQAMQDTPTRPQTTSSSESRNRPSLHAKLLQLNEVLDAGLVTEEEYAAKKEKILEEFQ